MNDYDSIQRRRNFIVGAFVLIALIALMWLVFIFGELPTAVSEFRSYEIYVQFPKASGIERNTPVLFAGYQVGRVIAIEPPRLMKDLRTGLDRWQTLIVLAIDKQFRNIPSNSSVKMIKRGLGSSYIEIDVDPTKPLVMLDPNVPESIYLFNGAKLQGSAGMTSEFFPEESQQKLDQLITSLNALIHNANVIIGDTQNQANMKTSLANLAVATEQATSTLKELEKLSTAAAKTAANVDITMTKVSDSLIVTSSEMSKTLGEVRQILAKVDQGQGSAGRFINDASLYDNLLDSSRELKTAIEQLKLMVAQFREKGVPIRLK